MAFFRLNFEILLACHSDSSNNDKSCLSRSELNDQSQSWFKGCTIGGFPRGPHHLRRESQQTAGNIDDFSVAGASSTIIYIRSNRPLNRLLKVEIHQSTHKVHHWATILRFLRTICFFTIFQCLIQLSLFRPYRVTAGTSGSEKMRSVNSSLYNQRFWSVIWFLSIPKIFWIFKDIHNIKDILVIWFLITQTTLWSTLPSSAIAAVTKYWLNWTRRLSNYK